MRQLSHRPHPWCASMQTRSPMANSSTVSPSATTVPVHSCPGVKAPYGRVSGKCPSKILRSVPQVPHMATRTSTSPGPGCGTGRSITRMSCGPKSTADRIVAGSVDCSTTAGSVKAMVFSTLFPVRWIKACSEPAAAPYGTRVAAHKPALTAKGGRRQVFTESLYFPTQSLYLLDVHSCYHGLHTGQPSAPGHTLPSALLAVVILHTLLSHYAAMA